jgi:hypothetical protein
MFDISNPKRNTDCRSASHRPQHPQNVDATIRHRSANR